VVDDALVFSLSLLPSGCGCLSLSLSLTLWLWLWSLSLSLLSLSLSYPLVVDDALVFSCHTCGPLPRFLIQAVLFCCAHLLLQLPDLKHATHTHTHTHARTHTRTHIG